MTESSPLPADSQQPLEALPRRRIPSNLKLPLGKILLTATLTCVLTAAVGFGGNVLTGGLGLVCFFVGIPFGLFALFWNIRLRRQLRHRHASDEFGYGSVFGSIPQIISATLNLGVIALIAWWHLEPHRIIEYNLDSIAGPTILFVLPVAGAALCITALFTIMSKQNLSEERHAVLYRLPARGLIRFNRALPFIVWLLVVAELALGWLVPGYDSILNF